MGGKQANVAAMKVIIDTNLLFSAVSKPDGKIAEIILNPALSIEFVGCYFSQIELFKYKEKILKVSKISEKDLLEIMYLLLKRIEFINESSIPVKIMQDAYSLTRDIDPKDTIFVAMSLFTGFPIWSGDKALYEGLHKKQFTNIWLTADLLQRINPIP